VDIEVALDADSRAHDPSRGDLPAFENRKFRHRVNAAGQRSNVGANRLSFAPNTSPAWMPNMICSWVVMWGSSAPTRRSRAGTFADLAQSPETKIPGYSLLMYGSALVPGDDWNAFLWVHTSPSLLLDEHISAGDVRLKPTGLPRTFRRHCVGVLQDKSRAAICSGRTAPPRD